MIEREYNRTSQFLVFVLGIRLSEFINHGFINSYLGDDGHDPHFQNCIYLRCKPVFSEAFTDFCEKMDKVSNFVADYDLPSGEVMFVFRVPDRYHQDLIHFKNGKYSNISKDYVIRLFRPGDFRYQICQRSPEQRRKLESELNVALGPDSELDSIPKPEEEIFRYNPIKSNW